MSGGTFEKNDIEIQIQTFDKKITEINYLLKKFLKKKNYLKIFLIILIFQ